MSHYHFMQPPTGNSAQWQSLFNGSDLSGWRANLFPESYRVVDGALRINALDGKPKRPCPTQ